MGNIFVRLDKLLVDRGLIGSRERAHALILAAKVLVNGRQITKAGQKVPADSNLEVVAEDHPFVSRGGLKLQHALATFGLDVKGLIGMDVGASTGGFTDCLLQYGASRVYAVDVGYGQLAWKLRQDPRVVVLERQNIRRLPKDQIPESIQVATIDTSFISLKLVIPAVMPFFDTSQDSGLRTQGSPPSQGKLVALIKPQFEAGRAQVGKGGVVRDPEVHRAVCESIADFCQALGFLVGGIITSPILGPKGNVEFLLFATYQQPYLTDR
jgi:23S rRNA (cytidine1920-2'-O)/16S rRNA (cytidine1409-2'-O)-methyltransferase